MKEPNMQNVHELVDFVNSGGLSRHKIFTEDNARNDNQVVLSNTTSCNIYDIEASAENFATAFREIEACGFRGRYNYEEFDLKDYLPQPVVVSKTTGCDKQEIRRLCKTLSQKEVASKFGVSQQYISKIVNA